MKNSSALLIVLAVLLPASIQGQSNDLAQLKKLNATFIHNFVTNNVPSHDAIIH
jgi:hypothetical protein